MLTRTVRRYVIALSIVVVLIALYAMAGFWAVPHFLRSGLNDFVSTHYKRQLTLGEIRFNPFTFKLDVSDFSLPDSDGQPMLAFGHLHVDLELKSLFRLGPDFREIILERPLVRAVIRHDGALNLADLGKGFPPAPAKPQPKPSEPMRLYIDRFAVVAGGGTFEDQSHSTPFRAELKPIAFELHNFRTRAKKGENGENVYSLNAASPQGERLNWSGTFLLEPVSSHGTFEVADLQASTIWSYLQQPMPVEIPSGVIAVKGEYNFDTVGDAPVIKVDVHDTTVSNLKLRPREGTTDYVVLGKLDVHETQVDVARKAVEIGKVTLTGGEVNAWLSPQGQLNLLELTGAPKASADAGATNGAAGAGADAAPGASGAAAANATAAGQSTAARNSPAPGVASNAAVGDRAPGAAPGPTSTAAGSTATVQSSASAGAQPAAPTSVPGGGAAAPVWTVSVPDISVEGFKVAAEDRQVTPALAVVLSPLDIHVAVYNTSPSARLDVTAKTSINNSATLNAKAQLAPSGGGDITAHVELAQLDLAMFQPFIAQRTAMTLKSGRLGTQLDIKKGADGSLSVKGDVGVAGLRSVDDLQQNFIRWKDLRIAGLEYNLQPASLHIDSITAREPYARVIIAPDRTVNVEEVLAGPSKGKPSLATQLGAANAQKANGITHEATKEAEAAKDVAREAAKEAKENPNSAADVAQGKVANAGAAAAAGAPGALAGASAANAPDKSAASTSAANAAPPGATAPGASAANAAPSSSAPSEAGEPGANAPAAGTRTAKAGRSRKSKPTNTESAPAPEPAAPVMPMSIGTVRIIDGSANYADFWIQPNFAVGIQTLNGSIDGLSSDPKSRAKVKLTGAVDRYAPGNIDGEMNLLAASVYSDIKMSFKGLELTTMTPYSGRFAGYKINKGKLSVDVTYKIDQRKLTAEQHFVIDQLQLGDPVDSPDAVHLPLKLAVALLKDRNGVIDVPLPISGSLDDPQFKVGPIIWHAVVNLLVKVATAPFAALGRLFGGSHGEEMKYIDFAPGSADLDDASKEKLTSLSKALQEHTQLQLDVPIVYSKELDTPELAKRRLNQKLLARAHSGKSPKQQASSGKAIKVANSQATAQPAPDSPPGNGQPSDTPDDPALKDPLQHYRLLLAEYEADVGKDTPLPATAQAIQTAKNKKDAPPVETAIPELEDAIIPHIDVPELTLQDLGKKRTRAIQDALLADGGIDASRVFIINGPPMADTSGKVRVEMSLK